MSKNINFDDGFESFTINGDPNRTIRVNPKDGKIIARFRDAMEKLGEESERFKNIRVDSSGNLLENNAISIEEGIDMLNEFGNIINVQLNYIFNSDVSVAAFGNQSPFSLVGNGDFLFEAFLQSALKTVSECMEDAAEETKKKMEKHTGKYLKEKTTKTN